MFVAPDGRVFNAGPNPDAKYLNVATSTWEGNYNSGGWRTPGVGGNAAGTAVMYAPGKILILGGVALNGSDVTHTTQRIDLNASAPAWQVDAPMAYPRCHANATLLPDGTVLVTGGSRLANSGDSGAVLPAELWTPGATGQPGSWRIVASMTTAHLYHSTAVLLPDARVLTTGGGQGGSFVDHPTAEIYSPPYLFTGRPRPEIGATPAVLAYGSSFTVPTPSTDVARATLVRLSSVTHSFNMNQRINELVVQSFSPGSDVTLQLPTSPNECPPGQYMLFLLDSQGVPSVARTVSVSGNTCGASTTLAAATAMQTACSATVTVTASGTNVGTDYKWQVDGAYQASLDGLTSITIPLYNYKTSAAVTVQVTPACGGAPVQTARTVHRYFPHCDPN